MRKSDYDPEAIGRFMRHVGQIHGPKVLSKVISLLAELDPLDEFIPKNIIEKAIKHCSKK
jgi:hypothetical protein